MGREPAPWRVLLSTRWILGHLLALSLVTLFALAGFWQLDRLEQKRASNEVRIEREQLPPLQPGLVAADTALLADVANAAELDLRHATASGVFQPEDELLLRSRSWNGQPGWHVLTPLLLADGSRLLVDRGWVPYELDVAPVAEAAPPAGEVEVTGVLRARQSSPTGLAASFAPRDPEEGTLAAAWYVDTLRLSQGQLPGLLPAAWLSLSGQLPEQAGELPRLPLVEPLDEGPHFGYALQWFSFAAVGVIGYWFLMRKVLRDAATAQRPA